MIISNSKRFIFIHINKAAGSSVTFALDQYTSWNDLVLGSTPFGDAIHLAYKERFNLYKHSLAKDVKTVVGENVWSGYFKFTFVRHPYARAVSLYTFIDTMVKRRWIGRYRRFFPLGKRFKERWNWPATRAYLKSRSFSDFIRQDEFLKDWAAQPQVNWISDDQKNVIVDFIGRVENLAADLEEIAKRIGVNGIQLFKKQASNNKRSPDYYFAREEDYTYLLELYREDFKVLGYDPKLRY